MSETIPVVFLDSEFKDIARRYPAIRELAWLALLAERDGLTGADGEHRAVTLLQRALSAARNAATTQPATLTMDEAARRLIEWARNRTDDADAAAERVLSEYFSAREREIAVRVARAVMAHAKDRVFHELAALFPASDEGGRKGMG